MAYAALWDLDDRVIDRDEVDAVVAHVSALAQLTAEVTPTARGLHLTFRLPVHAAADVVAALDPSGRVLGEDWFRDLDPPVDGEDGYTIRIELLGPVDGGSVDDDPDYLAPSELYDDGDDDDERDHDDTEEDDVEGIDDRCVARLDIERLDNREAWPVAFAIAAAIVDRLGGDLRDQLDEELFELQRTIPPIVVNNAIVRASTVPAADGDDELLN